MKFIIHLMKDLKFVECSKTIERYLIKFGTKVCYSDFGGMGFLVAKFLSVLQNFLASRKQRVVLNDQQSTYKDETVGVSQVSMLELLLFLMYINDLPESPNSTLRIMGPYSELFWSVFSAFGLNTERYGVSIRI